LPDCSIVALSPARVDGTGAGPEPLIAVTDPNGNAFAMPGLFFGDLGL
jgi:hypothetical protein